MKHTDDRGGSFCGGVCDEIFTPGGRVARIRKKILVNDMSGLVDEMEQLSAISCIEPSFTIAWLIFYVARALTEVDTSYSEDRKQRKAALSGCKVIATNPDCNVINRLRAFGLMVDIAEPIEDEDRRARTLLDIWGATKEGNLSEAIKKHRGNYDSQATFNAILGRLRDLLLADMPFADVQKLLTQKPVRGPSWFPAEREGGTADFRFANPSP